MPNLSRDIQYFYVTFKTGTTDASKMVKHVTFCERFQYYVNEFSLSKNLFSSPSHMVLIINNILKMTLKNFNQNHNKNIK